MSSRMAKKGKNAEVSTTSDFDRSSIPCPSSSQRASGASSSSTQVASVVVNPTPVAAQKRARPCIAARLAAQQNASSQPSTSTPSAIGRKRPTRDEIQLALHGTSSTSPSTLSHPKAKRARQQKAQFRGEEDSDDDDSSFRMPTRQPPRDPHPYADRSLPSSNGSSESPCPPDDEPSTSSVVIRRALFQGSSRGRWAPRTDLFKKPMPRNQDNFSETVFSVPPKMNRKRNNKTLPPQIVQEGLPFRGNTPAPLPQATRNAPVFATSTPKAQTNRRRSPVQERQPSPGMSPVQDVSMDQEIQYDEPSNSFRHPSPPRPRRQQRVRNNDYLTQLERDHQRAVEAGYAQIPYLPNLWNDVINFVKYNIDVSDAKKRVVEFVNERSQMNLRVEDFEEDGHFDEPSTSTNNIPRTPTPRLSPRQSQTPAQVLEDVESVEHVEDLEKRVAPSLKDRAFNAFKAPHDPIFRSQSVIKNGNSTRRDERLSVQPSNNQFKECEKTIFIKEIVVAAVKRIHSNWLRDFELKAFVRDNMTSLVEFHKLVKKFDFWKNMKEGRWELLEALRKAPEDERAELLEKKAAVAPKIAEAFVEELYRLHFELEQRHYRNFFLKLPREHQQLLVDKYDEFPFDREQFDLNTTEVVFPDRYLDIFYHRRQMEKARKRDCYEGVIPLTRLSIIPVPKKQFFDRWVHKQDTITGKTIDLVIISDEEAESSASEETPERESRSSTVFDAPAYSEEALNDKGDRYSRATSSVRSSVIVSRTSSVARSHQNPTDMNDMGDRNDRATSSSRSSVIASRAPSVARSRQNVTASNDMGDRNGRAKSSVRSSVPPSRASSVAPSHQNAPAPNDMDDRNDQATSSVRSSVPPSRASSVARSRQNAAPEPLPHKYSFEGSREILLSSIPPAARESANANRLW